MNATATIKTQDWHGLLTAVENNSGVYRVTMETLRQLEGRQRVGKHILKEIEEKLRTLGLGHLPQELPNRQQQPVLLFRFGSPASEVIQAVQNVSDPASESAYRALHRLNSLPDPETVVSRQEIGEAAKDATRAVLDLLLRVNGDDSTAAYSDGTNGSDRLDLTELARELSPTGEGFRR